MNRAAGTGILGIIGWESMQDPAQTTIKKLRAVCLIQIFQSGWGNAQCARTQEFGFTPISRSRSGMVGDSCQTTVNAYIVFRIYSGRKSLRGDVVEGTSGTRVRTSMHKVNMPNSLVAAGNMVTVS